MGAGGQSGAGDRQPALTDEQLERETRRVALAKEQTDLQRQRDALATERGNRALRGRVANGALLVMLLQILLANAIFVWYGDTNQWDVSPASISAWLGATVVQVVAVVLVITNYLFPRNAS